MVLLYVVAVLELLAAGRLLACASVEIQNRRLGA